jgi:hypothetical protein
VAPGLSVGTLAATTADLQSGSTYAVEITGAAAADKINASGAVMANGTIKITLSGYTPVGGEVFDILDAASITGSPTFDFSMATLTAPLTWDTTAFATTGTIKVSGGDPYDAWATANGITGGKMGDHDGDGLSNLLEFATNSNGASGIAGVRAYPAAITLSGSPALTITVATRKPTTFAADGTKQKATKDNVIYVIEGTTDLVNWTTATVTELNAIDSATVQATLSLPTLDAEWEWHSFRVQGHVIGDPRDFVRLTVTPTP